MEETCDLVNQKVISLLEEIKQVCIDVKAGVTSCRQELEEIKKDRKTGTVKVAQNLDKLTSKMSNVNLLMKEFSPQEIVTRYKISHPELVDTAPKELYEELTTAAIQVQGEADDKCAAFAERMQALTANRDSAQYLADCVAVLKEMRNEIVSRRKRIVALKERMRNSDKESNESKNAALLSAKVASIAGLLERFSSLVFNNYFAKRKRLITEIWRTTVAIEEMYDDTSSEYKEHIPSASAGYRISSALKNLSEISRRHEETHRANCLVQSGSMSALERRKLIAGLNPQKK